MISESMAISPTMNDQWSGKILSRTLTSHLDEPKRSSTSSSAFLPRVKRRWAAARSAVVLIAGSPPRPVAGPDRLLVVALGDDVAVAVDRYGKLWQRPRRRAEHRLGVEKYVEGGLVAGAHQLEGLLVVEAGRAPCVGADLREGHDAAAAVHGDVPALVGGHHPEGGAADVDQQRRCEGVVHVALGEHGDDAEIARASR